MAFTGFLITKSIFMAKFYSFEYVKNVNGSSRFDKPAGYSSWLDYWEDVTGLDASEATGYKREELDGCHVQLVDNEDKGWYITPMPSSWNHDDKEHFITWEIVPVPSRL